MPGITLIGFDLTLSPNHGRQVCYMLLLLMGVVRVWGCPKDRSLLGNKPEACFFFHLHPGVRQQIAASCQPAVFLKAHMLQQILPIRRPGIPALDKAFLMYEAGVCL